MNSSETPRLREFAAERLESAAESVRSAGDETAGAISDLAGEAGDKLDSSAEYVRTWAGGDVLGNLKAVIRRRPVEALVGATVLGLAVGYVCRRRESSSSDSSSAAKNCACA